jgi:hypothetical protein
LFEIADQEQWEFRRPATPVFRPKTSDDMVWGLTASLLERFMTLLPSVLYKR